MASIVKLLRHILIIALILCSTLVHSGCGQFLQIPIKLIGFIISLPIQIIKIAISLLPIIIKYAPLALLFVSADDSDTINEVDAIIYDLNEQGVDYALTVCSIPPSTLCYQFSFVEPEKNDIWLAERIESLLVNHQESRIVFAKEQGDTLRRNDLNALWQYMNDFDIRVAQDTNLVTETSYGITKHTNNNAATPEK